jgi:DNA-binding CsgD family transcriptional regulator
MRMADVIAIVDIGRRVTIVVPADSSLGVAMHAALAARGWLATLQIGSPGQPPKGTAESLRPPMLIVVEDDGGSAQPPAILTVSSALVCVGSLNSLSVLISFANQGATVLNQAAPFLVLIRAVEDALLPATGTGTHRTPAVQVDMLLRRRAEAAALQSLTPAEGDALQGMMAGLTATEIAAESHRSINTVRSQIKAVLGKLGVQTQLTAVAMAHRSGRWASLDRALAHFHQFW